VPWPGSHAPAALIVRNGFAPGFSAAEDKPHACTAEISTRCRCDEFGSSPQDNSIGSFFGLLSLQKSVVAMDRIGATYIKHREINAATNKAKAC
jgi:hypothetical protein